MQKSEHYDYIVHIWRIALIFPYMYLSKIVSEYDQEIPQSQTADNPMAPQGRATQPSPYNDWNRGEEEMNV